MTSQAQHQSLSAKPDWALAVLVYWMLGKLVAILIPRAVLCILQSHSGLICVLAIRFRNDQEGYACGGSGSLFRTDDGGKSWKRDRSTDQVAGNLYAIKFTEKGNGFILGNDGILLRYIA